MDKKSENQYFLLIEKKKISLIALDQNKELIPSREMNINNNSIDNIYFSLENFLEKNIFKIEKDYKNFIKKIYIIFESDNFVLVRTSIKHKSNKNNFNHEQIKESLTDIKNQLNKYSPEYKSIHMLISKFVIKGVDYNYLPENIDSNDLVIQVNFICLEKQILQNLKRIVSKYQISIEKILSYEYLKSTNNNDIINIIKLANNSINGNNVNEIFLVKKIPKINGFFEKFFNFFR